MVAVPQTLTIDDLIAIGLGELHWSITDLMQSRLSMFLLALRGHRQAEELRYRQHAEMIRLQTVELINIQLKKEDKIKSASSLWAFPWDAKKQDPQIEFTPEQVQDNIKRLMTAFHEHTFNPQS